MSVTFDGGPLEMAVIPQPAAAGSTCRRRLGASCCKRRGVYHRRDGAEFPVRRRPERSLMLRHGMPQMANYTRHNVPSAAVQHTPNCVYGGGGKKGRFRQ
jgi:hypothetical protein